MGRENVVKDKFFALALRIVELYRFLCQGRNEYVLSKQLLRSGTAIVAMVREAEHAESKADFVHKMSIALKEANESSYWMELLIQSNYLDDQLHGSIQTELVEVRKLLVSIIKTAKGN
jgi:four helix bundle protein